MSTPLASFQAAFAQALFAPAGTDGALVDVSGQAAFAVYRNTVTKACIDALEANFPCVARLVGTEWFRAAAALYVPRHPPGDARLLRYGEQFPAFLDTFEPARALPYLADVARLDRDWNEVHAAADADSQSGLFAALSPDALGATWVAPHPAARWRWFDDQPAFSIWSRNRAPGDDDSEIAWRPEGALLTRRDGAVVWRAASPADCAFLDACRAGAPLIAAAEAALLAEPDADLAALLAGLLRDDALVPFPLPDGATP